MGQVNVRVRACACVYIPSGMLTESCSLREGADVAGSAPCSPGDVRREELEGSVLRWRSSVRTTTCAHAFKEFPQKTTHFNRQFQETAAHPFRHSAPQVKGYVETNPQHPI